VEQDGVIGPQTLAMIDQIAARPDGIAALSAEFLAQRLAFMATLPTWRVFGLGWARRLCRLPYQALAIAS
jgi:lysozyme family protein